MADDGFETASESDDEAEEMDFEMIDGAMRETKLHKFKFPSMTNPPLLRNK